jgi:hypothetical protein
MRYFADLFFCHLLAHLLSDQLELSKLDGAAVVLIELLENSQEILFINLRFCLLHQNITDKLQSAQCL